MPVVRIYIPVGGHDLEVLSGTGVLKAGPDASRAAFAVTDALVARAPGVDIEDLEYAAFTDAVAAAAKARSRRTDRRVVASADADPDWVSSGGDVASSAVELVASVPVSRIASFHIDEHAGADTGAGDVVDHADELLWYDVTELEDVRSLVSE